jgi:ABC-type branched-subunit amino acid transport system substrate-binding protein
MTTAGDDDGEEGVGGAVGERDGAADRLKRQPCRCDDTIKVGVLHSLSGTMAISETTLKDAMLMLIDEQNKKGGLLGKKLEPSSSIRLPIGRCLPKRRAS